MACAGRDVCFAGDPRSRPDRRVLVAFRLRTLGAPRTTCLQEHHGQRKPGEGPAVTFTAAHRVLQQREAFEILPSKTGNSEIVG